jgi:hypothetical protein
MPCSIRTVVLGYRVWRELERQRLCLAGEDVRLLPEPAPLDIQVLSKQAPEPLVSALAETHTLRAHTPPAKWLVGLATAGFLLWLLSSTAASLVVTLATNPGALVGQALLWTLALWLAYQVWFQGRRLHRFLSLLCALGQAVHLTEEPIG